MSNPPYIDFHTHTEGASFTDGVRTWAVESVFWGEQRVAANARYCTVGIHPMQPNVVEILRSFSSISREDAVKAFLEQLSTEQREMLVAIGECGWDRRSLLDVAQQNFLFDLQYDVSCQLGVPMIIHNVGATHLLLAAIKRLHIPDRKLWIHGFRGKVPQMTQMVQAGICFGLSVHIDVDRAMKRQLQNTVYMLETDESGRRIEDVYRDFARKVGCCEDMLKSKLFDTFEQNFLVAIK